MRTYYYLPLLLLLAPVFSFGQSGFYRGYAVTIKGDTLKGYLEYVAKENNPKTILYKTDANNNTPRKLSPRDITYLNIDIGSPVEFQRYEGAITMDKTDIQDLPTARDTSFRIDTVFLKVQQRGKNVILFSYDDPLKTRYFIADAPDFRPVELIHRIYYNTNTSGSFEGTTTSEDTYKKQLMVLAAKYDAMNEKLQFTIQKLSYAESDLVTISSKINGLSSASKSNHEKPRLLKLVVAVAIFAVAAYLTFSVMHH